LFETFADAIRDTRDAIRQRSLSAQKGNFNHFQTKICQTNPISETSKIHITSVTAMTTNKKQQTMNYLKQTQTNPIQSQFLLAVRGAKPKQSQFKANLPKRRPFGGGEAAEENQRLKIKEQKYKAEIKVCGGGKEDLEYGFPVFSQSSSTRESSLCYDG
jgi:hypothetical protein